MTGHDHQAAQLAVCEECGAPSGLACRNWAGVPAVVPCPTRLAAVRQGRAVLLVDWLELAELDLAAT